MRKRELVEKDGTRLEILQLEVLLDLRSLLEKLVKSEKRKNKKNA